MSPKFPLLGRDDFETASLSARSGAADARVSRCMRDGTSAKVQLHQSGPEYGVLEMRICS